MSILKENPKNKEIYGDDDPKQLEELEKKIISSGWIKPLIVNRDWVILSGHRRFFVAKKLGRIEIDVEKFMGDDEKELEVLLNENFHRIKTNTQLIREAECYRKIEERKAEERRSFMGLKNLGHLSDVDILPPSIDAKGKVRDIIAEKIGMSGKSYDKARKVIHRLDKEKDSEIKSFFKETLDKSIDAASRLAEKPDDFVHEVMERTDQINKVGSVIRELEKEEIKKEVNLPTGKHEVIYMDASDKCLAEASQLPISDICEEDSVLYLWTTPTLVEEGIKVGREWGFKYRTCMISNTDFFKDVMENFDIMLIFTRGKADLITKPAILIEKTVKPSILKEKIDNTYSGKKIELQFDNGILQGWKYWGE